MASKVKRHAARPRLKSNSKIGDHATSVREDQSASVAKGRVSDGSPALSRRKKGPSPEDLQKDADGLNYRQRRFVAEYATSLNATESAIKAGYSKNGAAVTGSQLLRNPNVAKAVGLTQRRRLSRADITAERVLAELAHTALGESEPTLPKPSDKIAALNTLARHLGLLVERVEVDSTSRVLNVTASVADLESSRLLADSIFKRDAPQIEGKVEDENPSFQPEPRKKPQRAPGKAVA